MKQHHIIYTCIGCVFLCVSSFYPGPKERKKTKMATPYQNIMAGTSVHPILQQIDQLNALYQPAISTQTGVGPSSPTANKENEELKLQDEGVQEAVRYQISYRISYTVISPGLKFKWLRNFQICFNVRLFCFLLN